MIASFLHPWRDGDPGGMGWRPQARAGGTALPQASRVAPGTAAQCGQIISFVLIGSWTSRFFSKVKPLHFLNSDN